MGRIIADEIIRLPIRGLSVKNATVLGAEIQANAHDER